MCSISYFWMAVSVDRVHASVGTNSPWALLRCCFYSEIATGTTIPINLLAVTFNPSKTIFP
jgi:hypothetical protein